MLKRVSRLAVSLALVALAGCGGGEAPDLARSDLLLYAATGERGYADVFVVRIDGTERRKLTRHRWEDYDAAWSPDGRSIVFVRQNDDATEDLFVLDVASGRAQPVARTPDVDEESPSWSARGWIYFVADAGLDGIWRIRPDGSDAERVVSAGSSVADVAVSRDGARIAYAGDLSGWGDWDIYVADADGGDEHRLTTHDDIELEPAWSPDGKQIAFERRSITGTTVWTVPSDGGRPHRLSRVWPGATDASPVWSRDGFHVATFGLRDRDVGFALYVARADGSDARVVTAVRGVFYSGPEWQP